MTDGAQQSPGSAASTETDDGGTARAGMSRRGLLASAAGGLVLGVAGGVAGTVAARAAAAGGTATDPDAVDPSLSYDFYTGEHQVGVHTPPQRYCVFMTFTAVDGTTTSELQVLLARWSAAMAQLMKGRSIGAIQPPQPSAVPTDTGEAADLGPNALTVTLGLGPGIFDRRFGLADKRPALLAELPELPSDQLQKEFTGGDLSLQACADDPQVAYHAIRDLARMGRGTVNTGWTVMGFGRASAGPHQRTPRNLMGFKDGTRNISTDDDYRRFVWVKNAGWMTGGTYQIVRKIQMNIEIWDADHVGDQQHVFGRTKQVGAPLTGTSEHDTPKFDEKRDGRPIIPADAHIALAAHENNDGIKILRRPYNYTDGINRFGQLDAGLLFLVYANDPGHFVRLQRKLGASDRLNEYISHIGSAVFAVPPAPRAGHYIGEELFS